MSLCVQCTRRHQRAAVCTTSWGVRAYRLQVARHDTTVPRMMLLPRYDTLYASEKCMTPCKCARVQGDKMHTGIQVCVCRCEEDEPHERLGLKAS